MLISYAKYIDLMSALDEHCRGTLPKRDIQSIIFKHYMSKYGSFVAENSKGDKKLFAIKMQKNNDIKRRSFIRFMNESKSN